MKRARKRIFQGLLLLWLLGPFVACSELPERIQSEYGDEDRDGDDNDDENHDGYNDNNPVNDDRYREAAQ